MRDLDLTEAIETAATRLCHVVTDEDGRGCIEHDNDVTGQLTNCGIGWDTANRAVRAAAPIIERQVRERIAAGCTRQADRLESRGEDGYAPLATAFRRGEVEGYRNAARIARGES